MKASLLLCGATAEVGPRTAYSWGSSITHKAHTSGRTPLDKWSVRRRGRFLHNTQPAQETNIHALNRIRTRDPSSQTALDRTATGIVCTALLHKNVSTSQPFVLLLVIQIKRTNLPLHQINRTNLPLHQSFRLQYVYQNPHLLSVY
jgi:hypothetical protein